MLEKALKALYVSRRNNSLPPKIHNLVRLAELAEANASEEQIDMLDRIHDFNIEARYQDYKFTFYRMAAKTNFRLILLIPDLFRNRNSLRLESQNQ